MAALPESKTNFKRALDQLQSGAQKNSDEPVVLAGIIKFFELTYETAWRALKAHLEEKGTIALSPRAVFENAFQQGLLTKGET